MKSFFFPTMPLTPHIEIELELIKDHLVKHDEVVVMVCGGGLGACHVHQYHKARCFLCRSMIKRGLDMLKCDNLQIVNYPVIEVDYSHLPCRFGNMEELKKFEHDGVLLGLAAASSLVSLHRESNLDTSVFKDEVLRQLKHSFYISEVFSRYVIPVIRPDLVYIFNGRFSTTAPVVDVCRNSGVDFMTHECAGRAGRYWTIKNAVPHDLDAVGREIERVWESCTPTQREDYGNRFFKERRKGVEQVYFSFLSAQKKDVLPRGFSEAKKNIVFFNSTEDEHVAVRGWENRFFLFTDERDAIRSICEYFEGDASKQFYLRVHPNLMGCYNSQVRALNELSLALQNLEVIPPESSIDTYALMENCDLVITFGSTTGIEAVYWGKPSLQLGIAYYGSVGATYVPKSKDELFDLIGSKIDVQSREGALKYGVWEMMRGHSYRYFKQTGVRSGNFMGKKVRASLLLHWIGCLVLCVKFIITKIKGGLWQW